MIVIVYVPTLPESEVSQLTVLVVASKDMNEFPELGLIDIEYTISFSSQSAPYVSVIWSITKLAGAELTE